MFAVKSKRGFGVFNGERWLIAPNYRWIGFFFGGYAYARAKSGAECLLSSSGEQHDLLAIARSVCPCESFEFISPNNSTDAPGSLLLSTDTSWVVATLDSQLIPKKVAEFSKGCDLAVYFGWNDLFLRVKEKGRSKMVVVNSGSSHSLDGFEYIDPPISRARLLAAKRSGDSSRWTYCDPSENFREYGSYFLAQTFSDELGMVQREVDSRFEFLDSRLQSSNELVFEWADVFRYGLAAATKNGVTGYYDVYGCCQIDCDGVLGRFNRLGHAVVVDESGSQHARIINRAGVVLIDMLETCTYFDGDFPCYHAQLNGREVVLTESLQLIYQDK